MAADLGVSEGMAGQAVSVTAIVAMSSSLFVAVATRGYDRRLVMLTFTMLFTLSSALVGMATDYTLLLAARVLLGVSLGGFWSMAASISMRLVPMEAVPRALSIVFGGVSAAMVIAGPIGSMAGDLIGWRGVFLATAGIGAVTLVWQFLVLPSMPPIGDSSLSTPFGLLRRPLMLSGIVAMMLVFGGHFAFFTYLRPFMEAVAGMDVKGVSAVLLSYGVANIVGTPPQGY